MYEKKIEKEEKKEKLRRKLKRKRGEKKEIETKSIKKENKRILLFFLNMFLFLNFKWKFELVHFQNCDLI